MQITGKEDIRVQKTLKAIHDAFSSLLQEMPYEKISVKALCERAMINKTTFYRYYPTLDDLLEQVQSELAAPYVNRTSGLRYPEDIEQIVREFMVYSAQQGPLYDAILSSGVYASIMQKMLEDMSKERDLDFKPPRGWNDVEWALYIDHVNSSQVRIYSKWVADGRKIPAEQMAEMAVRLICDGARL